jgi:hypothetical protein
MFLFLHFVSTKLKCRLIAANVHEMHLTLTPLKTLSQDHRSRCRISILICFQRLFYGTVWNNINRETGRREHARCMLICQFMKMFCTYLRMFQIYCLLSLLLSFRVTMSLGLCAAVCFVFGCRPDPELSIFINNLAMLPLDRLLCTSIDICSWQKTLELLCLRGTCSSVLKLVVRVPTVNVGTTALWITAFTCRRRLAL